MAIRLVSVLKRPIKAVLERFVTLDALARRFLYKKLAPRLYYHEPEMLVLSQLKPLSFGTSIDVGAALGTYCWVLAPISHQVLAFEPGRHHFKALKTAARGSKIEVHNFAVGAEPGQVELATPHIGYGSRFGASISQDNPLTQTPNASAEVVSQVSLDEFAGPLVATGSWVDFIKVDVEGYELEVLRGATELIDRFHPIFLCEIEARHNANYASVFEFLTNLGYETSFLSRGNFSEISVPLLEEIQKPEDLERRLHGSMSERAKYINNFWFIHPESRVSLSE